MARPTLGSTVGGKYKLLRALGEGGMGTVYEVEHVLTHKRAAIKWVHPQTGSSDSVHDRLLHEARATSRIHHRNVVDVYDVLREDDAVCLVMQLLVGEPLSELIARGPMPLHDFIALLLPAMRGVAAAHAVGVIHRDIKPDNIFLSKDPGQSEIVPTVIDFGISKVFDPRAPNHTRSGVTMGTPKYVSYEQLLGARDVDARADVYAFGVMLYEAITGEPPYRAGTFGEQAVAFAMSVPPRPSVVRPGIPVALDVLVYRAIAKERDQRIAGIESLISELEPFADPKCYPQPVLAFSAPVRRTSGARPDDATSPAVATPASQHRDSLPEMSRLSPTPRAPMPVVPVSRPVRPPMPLASVIVTACAAGLLGLLVWSFQVSSRRAPALPPARAEAPKTTGLAGDGAHGLAPTLVTSPEASIIGATPQLPSARAETPNEASALPASAPLAAPLAGATRLEKRGGTANLDTGAGLERAERVTGAAGLPRERSRDVVPEAAPTRAVVAPASAPGTEAQKGDPASVEAGGTAREPNNETHRAGRLARDEF